MSGQFWEQFRKVLSWIFQKEVKTPLSFNFRVAGLIAAMFAVALIWGNDLELKKIAVYAAFGLMLLLVILVAIFSWFRPKNIVYGEPGHRAELKMSYGTEKRQLSSDEIAVLPGTEKPIEITASGEPS
jgi:hypothetical protein